MSPDLLLTEASPAARPLWLLSEATLAPWLAQQPATVVNWLHANNFQAERQRVLVQGVNMVRKNKKVDYQGQRGAKTGGIVNTEAPIHVSNVQLIDPDTKKPARAGFRYGEDGTKVRVSRAGGKDF